jgi:hypothetical protein
MVSDRADFAHFCHSVFGTKGWRAGEKRFFYEFINCDGHHNFFIFS